MEDLRAHFRPEFLNRLDETVVFHRLDRAQIRRIVEIQLVRFEKRLGARGLALEISDAAKDLLGQVGYDPTFGARPLKRAIQRLIENPLAQELLAGRYAPGDVVIVDVGVGGELGFGKRAGHGNRDELAVVPNAPPANA
jgi:ATP-dependent Clp protease ATP-binding subunit ClpB